ncbi:MAG: DUF3575 domain-containing protein [Prevotella sp.]|nr:DUF3575 domain-containing protein [Prevotella sp.]
MNIRIRLIAVFTILTILTPATAQTEKETPPEAYIPTERPMIVDHERHIDTLSVMDRIALRTNSTDWLLLIPNAGIEFDIRNTNYNRNTIGLNIRYNWQTSHTYKPGVVYNIAEARIGFRNYFRVKEISKDERDWNMHPHKHIWDKPFSARHKKSKHPDAVFYRGAYLAFTKYSVMFGSEGRQGTAVSAGYQFGMVKPLYVFRNGHSLDLDLGAALGVAYTSYNKYRLDRESDCYPNVGKVDGQIMPMVNELRCALVYRLGKTPGTSKYRWRYDVDVPYMNMKDSIYFARVAHKQDLHNTDSIQSMIRKDFWAVYDSLVTIERANTDSLNKIKLMEQKAQAELLKSQRAADKEKKKADKAALKAAQAAVRESPEGSESPKPEAKEPENTKQDEDNTASSEEGKEADDDNG